MIRRSATGGLLSRRHLFRCAAAVGATAVGDALPIFFGHVAADDPAVFPIGLSVQGRPIPAIRVGKGPVWIVALGGIHTGDERNTVELVTALAHYFTANPGELPTGTSLICIPSLNVDGLALETRTNAHDVDLNRNWPARWQPWAYHGDEIVSGGAAPLSEPETAALYAMLQAFHPHAVLSWHSQYPPLGEAEGNSAAPGPTGEVTGKTLARLFAASAGADYLEQWIAYPVSGQLLDTLEDLGIPGMDIELPSYDGTFFTENLAGLQRVADELVRTLRT